MKTLVFIGLSLILLTAMLADIRMAILALPMLAAFLAEVGKVALRRFRTHGPNAANAMMRPRANAKLKLISRAA